MVSKYLKYKVEDFLTDDYFIDTMLNPTTQSETFWKTLIDKYNLNIDEFISAYMTLKELHGIKPEVSSEKIDLIWERINYTNDSRRMKKNRFRIFGHIAAASCFVGVIGFSAIHFLKSNPQNLTQSITDFAHENIINTKQPNKLIQLVVGNNKYDVEGSKAKVEYDKNGNVRLNQHSVASNLTAVVTNDVPVFNQLKVPYGKRAFLKLSDGSKLWVNTGTTVIYPSTFNKDKREVFVEGEVYAEVAHESNRPFIIKTDKLDIKVLGTVFNVSAYKEDLQTNVILVSGLVSVVPLNGKSTIIKPNQLYSCSAKASTLNVVNVENFTSWHDGVYIFKSEPIENILLRLSRYYNVTMKLPTNPSGISCSGKLELKDNLNELLDGLSEITSMTYAAKNDDYNIKFE